MSTQSISWCGDEMSGGCRPSFAVAPAAGALSLCDDVLAADETAVVMAGAASVFCAVAAVDMVRVWL